MLVQRRLAAARAADARLGGAGRAYLGLALAVVLWGTLHSMAKLALLGLAPTQFTFLRAALGGVFLVLVCLLTGRRAALRAQLARPWVPAGLGLLAFTLSNHLSMASLVYLDAGTNGVLAGTSPLFAVIGAPLARERPAWAAIFGAAVGFAGVALLAGDAHLGTAALVGVLMALAGAAAWTLYTLFGRRSAVGVDPLAFTAVAGLAGAIPLGLLAAADTAATPLTAPSIGVALAALWCGIAGTGVTYTLWINALRHLPASRVAPTQYLNPPMGLFFAWLILAKSPSPALLAGTALILLGVVFAQQPWRWR